MVAHSAANKTQTGVAENNLLCALVGLPAGRGVESAECVVRVSKQLRALRCFPFVFCGLLVSRWRLRRFSFVFFLGLLWWGNHLKAQWCG